MTTISPRTPNSNPVYVYRLIDPRDEHTFYVGITVALYERFKQHMRCDGTNLQKDQRIQEILIDGHVPLIRTIEPTKDFEQAMEREQYWIQHFQKLGFKLTNARLQVRISSRVKRVRLPMPCANSGAGIGRERDFASTVEMLIAVRDTGKWPENISSAMQRYYKREYPEFFKSGQKWAKMREEKMQKASLLRKRDRPSRRRKPIKSA